MYEYILYILWPNFLKIQYVIIINYLQYCIIVHKWYYNDIFIDLYKVLKLLP